MRESTSKRFPFDLFLYSRALLLLLLIFLLYSHCFSSFYRCIGGLHSWLRSLRLLHVANPMAGTKYAGERRNDKSKSNRWYCWFGYWFDYYCQYVYIQQRRNQNYAQLKSNWLFVSQSQNLKKSTIEFHLPLKCQNTSFVAVCICVCVTFMQANDDTSAT